MVNLSILVLIEAWIKKEDAMIIFPGRLGLTHHIFAVGCVTVILCVIKKVFKSLKLGVWIPPSPSLTRGQPSHSFQQETIFPPDDIIPKSNPEMGVISVWICSVFFNTQTNPKKSIIWWLKCLQRVWTGGWAEPSSLTQRVSVSVSRPSVKTQSNVSMHLLSAVTVCSSTMDLQISELSWHWKNNYKNISHPKAICAGLLVIDTRDILKKSH